MHLKEVKEIRTMALMEERYSPDLILKDSNLLKSGCANIETLYECLKQQISVKNFGTFDQIFVNLDGITLKTVEDVSAYGRAVREAIDRCQTQKLYLKQMFSRQSTKISEQALQRFATEEFTLSTKFFTILRFSSSEPSSNLSSDSKRLSLIEQTLVSHNVKGAKFFNNEVIANRFGILSMMGEGTYGTVFKALDFENPKPSQQSCDTTQLYAKVAVKRLKKNEIACMHTEVLVRKEIQLLKKMNHPHVVRLIDAIEIQDSMNIVTDFFAKGSLESLQEVDEHMTYEEPQAARYCSQLCSALIYVHSEHHVIHRDLQLSNVCLDENDCLKLVDFGLADYFTPGQNLHTTRCGHSKYMAPEMLMGKTYCGPEVDVWSLGVILFKLVVGYFPFFSAHNSMSGKFSVPLEDEPISEECKDLLRRMLTVDSLRRITLQEVQVHPWLKKYLALQQQ